MPFKPCICKDCCSVAPCLPHVACKPDQVFTVHIALCNMGVNLLQSHFGLRQWHIQAALCQVQPSMLECSFEAAALSDCNEAEFQTFESCVCAIRETWLVHHRSPMHMAARAAGTGDPGR